MGGGGRQAIPSKRKNKEKITIGDVTKTKHINERVGGGEARLLQ